MLHKLQRALQLRWLKRLPVGVIFIIVILVALGITTAAIAVAPDLLNLISLSNTQWSQLVSIITVATFAFALGAGVSILLEISEANDSRNLGIYQDIYEKLMSSAEIEARRYIYEHLPDFQGLGAAQRDAECKKFTDTADDLSRRNLKQTLNLFDYFGFLVEQEWVTADAVIGWLSPVVVKVWAKIGPLVEYERRLRPEEPDYYQSAVNLAQKCTGWRNQHYPGRKKDIKFDRSRL
jgi:hypothetical protein